MPTPIQHNFDGTAGHTKKRLLLYPKSQSENGPFGIGVDRTSRYTAMVSGDNAEPAIANAYLFLLAQSAPHDCGDPECPGFQNKRKLELYDKFQRAIHEFAQAGLLNQCQHEETRNNICKDCGQLT